METFLAWLIGRSNTDLGDLVGEFALDYAMDSRAADQLERELVDLMERVD